MPDFGAINEQNVPEKLAKMASNIVKILSNFAEWWSQLYLLHEHFLATPQDLPNIFDDRVDGSSLYVIGVFALYFHHVRRCEKLEPFLKRVKDRPELLSQGMVF